MSEEIGTLAELKVKPGDVVEYRGREYEVCAEPKPRCAGDLWAGVEGYFHGWIDQDAEGCRLVSRASDTPKTWGEMTDAEKGALLLHEYRYGGKSVQYSIPVHEQDDSWGEKMVREAYHDDWIYRVRPEPKRVTVTLYAGCKKIGWIDLKDGEPDPDSIKMERRT